MAANIDTLSSGITRPKPISADPFLEALKNRRTLYALSSESTISDQRIQQIVEHIVTHVPSPFNVQSCRAVILLKKDHQKFWDLSADAFKANVPGPVFEGLKPKIEGFRNAYGTVLFYEDMSSFDPVKQRMGDRWPIVEGKCPQWSEHSSGMHQYATWTALEAEGLGCNLQHYNPIVNGLVQETWGVDKGWDLKSQLVFGKPTSGPMEKTFKPLESRVFVHGA